MKEQPETNAKRNVGRLKALILFFFAVLILTKLDFVVNEALYEYGLQFSYGWYHEYVFHYALSYQLILLLLYLWTCDWKLILVLEGFVLSSGQDLIFFTVWNRGFPEGEWTWMIFHRIFGFWNTNTQILLTVSVTLACFVLTFIVSKAATTVPKILGIDNPAKRTTRTNRGFKGARENRDMPNLKQPNPNNK